MNRTQKIAFIIFPLLISFFGSFIFYNYLPLSLTELDRPEKFGTTITTINGSDTISASRSVINTNFSNLNSGKIETSTTSLPLITTLSGLTSAASLASVGTLTTGVWQGTLISAQYGGTGWGYITPNTLLLGNGSNRLATTTAGSDGQVLGLSGGVPTWQSTSVDQAEDYSWTGSHSFFGTTTLATTTNTVNAYPTASTSVANKGYSDQKDTSYAFGQVASSTPFTGQRTFTHNLGSIPRFIKIFAVGGTSGDALGFSLSQGYATSVSSQGSTVLYNNAGTMTGLNDAVNIIYLNGRTNRIIAAALSAITSTTFTLNFTTFESNATLFMTWEAYE